MSELAISTHTLTRDFATVRAVDQLTIEIPKGVIFGFLGPNGAGKTTTFHLLLGLLAPTDGTATVLGCDSQTQGEIIRSQVGVLLEHHGLYERMNAMENLYFFGRINHMSNQDIATRSEALLKHMGLWGRHLEPVKRWSKGMKQKLAIIRATLHQPAMIFLDEPTAGLDPVAAVALREDLINLTKREGMTIILNTHNLTEAEKLCDQIGIIRQGKLLRVGTLEQLRSEMTTPEIKITGHGFGEDLRHKLESHTHIKSVSYEKHMLCLKLSGDMGSTPFIRQILDSGGEIDEVHRLQASLESVYLNLMEQTDD